MRALGAVVLVGIVLVTFWWFTKTPSSSGYVGSMPSPYPQAIEGSGSRNVPGREIPAASAPSRPATAGAAAPSNGVVRVSVFDDLGAAVVPAYVAAVPSNKSQEADAAGTATLVFGECWRGSILVSAPGHAPTRLPDVECPLGAIVELKARVYRGVKLSVLVTIADGSPIQGAVVEVSSNNFWGFPARYPNAEPTARKATDSDGTAVFTDLFPGPYDVRTSLSGYCAPIHHVVLNDQSPAHTLTIVMRQGRTVSVSVVDSGQQAVPSVGLVVWVGTNPNGFMGVHAADENGHFEMTVPREIESIRFSEPSRNEIDVVEPSTFAVADAITVTVRLPSVVPCTVTRSDGSVVLSCRIDYVDHLSGAVPMASEESVIDAAGLHYARRQGVGYAPWFRFVDPEFGLSKWHRVPQRERVTLPLRVSIRLYGRLSGRVVDQSGAPLSGASVSARRAAKLDPDTAFDDGAFEVAHALTGNDGRFTVLVSNDYGLAIVVTKDRYSRGIVFVRGPQTGTASLVPGQRLIRWASEDQTELDLGDISVRLPGRVQVRVSSQVAGPHKVWLVPAGDTAANAATLSTMSDASGLAEFDSVSPGFYEVDAIKTGPLSPRPPRFGPPAGRVFVEPGHLVNCVVAQ